MQERIAAALLLVVPVSDGSAEHAVPAAVRDATELLDVDMHQLAGAGLLITNRTGLANRQPRGPIDVNQQRHRVSGKHPTNRRPRNTQVIADPVRTPASREPQRQNPTLEPLRHLLRRVVRTRRSIGHRLTGAEPCSPLPRSRG
jgi:hypothetical protein